MFVQDCTSNSINTVSFIKLKIEFHVQFLKENFKFVSIFPKNVFEIMQLKQISYLAVSHFGLL